AVAPRSRRPAARRPRRRCTPASTTAGTCARRRARRTPPRPARRRPTRRRRRTVPPSDVHASPPRERRERAEQRPLDGERRSRRLALALELARDQRELEQARIALPVQPALVCEAEEEPEEVLAAQGGPQLEQGVHPLAVGGEQAVRHAGGNVGGVAGTEHPAAGGKLEPELARDDVVPLALARVHVLPDDEALRAEDELVLERVAAGLRRRAPEDEPLARHRVLEHVACLRHGATISRRRARLRTDVRSRARTGRYDAGVAAMIPKVAPCGSPSTARRPTIGTSIGSSPTVAPSSFALATVPSTSATATYGRQCGGDPSKPIRPPIRASPCWKIR